MSVESAIKLQVDRMAKGRQTAQAAFATGDDFWTKVDAAGDETYENRVKGSDITALDAALAASAVWSTTALAKWFALHQAYLQTDLGLSSPYLASYLLTKGWRVPFEAAESLAEALGSANRLAAQWVFPKGTRVATLSDPSSAGMHHFGYWTGTGATDTWTSVDGALSAYVKGAVVMLVSREATPGGTSPVALATLQDATTKQIAFTPSASQYGQVLLGAGAVGVGGAASGQKDVLVKTSVAQFKAAEWLMLSKADYSVQEVVQIDSLVTLTLTMKTNLINSWLENDLVLPMFTNAARYSGSITSGKHIDAYAFPDRIIAL